MKIDHELRAEVLAKLGLTDAAEDIQNAALNSIETVSSQRIAMLLPQMLTEEQLAEVEGRQKSGEDADDIMEWVTAQIPQFGEMVKASILDATDDAVAYRESVDPSSK